MITIIMKRFYTGTCLALLVGVMGLVSGCRWLTAPCNCGGAQRSMPLPQDTAGVGEITTQPS